MQPCTSCCSKGINDSCAYSFTKKEPYQQASEIRRLRLEKQEYTKGAKALLERCETLETLLENGKTRDGHRSLPLEAVSEFQESVKAVASLLLLQLTPPKPKDEASQRTGAKDKSRTKPPLPRKRSSASQASDGCQPDHYGIVCEKSTKRESRPSKPSRPRSSRRGCTSSIMQGRNHKLVVSPGQTFPATFESAVNFAGATFSKSNAPRIPERTIDEGTDPCNDVEMEMDSLWASRPMGPSEQELRTKPEPISPPQMNLESRVTFNPANGSYDETERFRTNSISSNGTPYGTPSEYGCASPPTVNMPLHTWQDFRGFDARAPFDNDHRTGPFHNAPISAVPVSETFGCPAACFCDSNVPPSPYDVEYQSPTAFTSSDGFAVHNGPTVPPHWRNPWEPAF